MCGLAGIIHRDGPSDLGTEITTMLQSMKHRGPDSTGYALYGQPDDLIVVRFVLAEPREYGGFGVEERLERSRAEVESRLAKIGAEYVLRWLPPGTHEFAKFLRPEEVSGPLEAAGLVADAPQGVSFNPLSDQWKLSSDTKVNYMIVARRPE